MDRTLDDWADHATAALGLPETARWVADRDTITWTLEIAKEIAHGAVRPAAPIATFLAGVAIGLAGADDPKARERVRAQLLSTLTAPENGS